MVHERITLSREAGSNTWKVQHVLDAMTEARFLVNEMRGIEHIERGTDETAGIAIRTVELVVQGAAQR